MNTKNRKLPYSISEYIKEHFREDFLAEVKETRQWNGRWYYTIEITKDDYIHTLKFNEDGKLITDEADHAFPPDAHEGPAFEDVPD